MGRLFLETLSDSSDAGGAIYACVGCGAELASSSALVWEVRGIGGAGGGAWLARVRFVLRAAAGPALFLH